MEKNIFEINIDKVVIPEDKSKSAFTSHLANLTTLITTDETIKRYNSYRQRN